LQEQESAKIRNFHKNPVIKPEKTKQNATIYSLKYINYQSILPYFGIEKRGEGNFMIEFYNKTD